MNDSSQAANWQLLGSELSPFSLKMSLMLRYAGLAYLPVPQQAQWREALAVIRRQAAVRAGKLPVHWPPVSADDELPLLPFLFAQRSAGKHGTGKPDAGAVAGRFARPQHNIYDSTALAEWLADHSPRSGRFPPFTADDPAADFVIRLIDDYADEFGLYMAHHNRWVAAAGENSAGARLAEEWRVLLPLAALRRGVARRFAARQVRRLPYLFSVAPAGFACAGLAAELQPPSLAGFPPTHELLNDAFLRLLASLEPILERQEFLFGHRLSLADAAIYGQLSINMDDPAAERLIARNAPATHRWLQRLRAGPPSPSYAAFKLRQGLKPLLAEICRTHVPLMQQNLQAYRAAGFSSAAQCNEPSFSSAEHEPAPELEQAMYDGSLYGQPFRAVVKSFQVASWQQCRRRWQRLSEAEREQVAALLPANHGLNSDTPLAANPSSSTAAR